MCSVKDDQSVVVDREPDQEKGLDPSGPASDAPNVVGLLERKTAGLVAADTNGTHSTLVGCAQRASINGLQPSASSVAGGRRIRIGMRSDSAMFARKGVGASSCYQQSPYLGVKIPHRRTLIGQRVWNMARSEGGIPCLRSKQTTSP
jgi:hypothetical protein